MRQPTAHLRYFPEAAGRKDLADRDCVAVRQTRERHGQLDTIALDRVGDALGVGWSQGQDFLGEDMLSGVCSSGDDLGMSAGPGSDDDSVDVRSSQELGQVPVESGAEVPSPGLPPRGIVIPGGHDLRFGMGSRLCRVVGRMDVPEAQDRQSDHARQRSAQLLQQSRGGFRLPGGRTYHHRHAAQDGCRRSDVGAARAADGHGRLALHGYRGFDSFAPEGPR